MRCDHNQLGAFTITDDFPAGQNPRDGDAFATAQAEIDKLNNIHADASVDWQKLSSLCEDILVSEGKDLNVAVWLLCAWTRLHGLTGLSDGVHVLKDVLTLYWTDMTPPLARLRARRNQIEWLLEWLDKVLEETFEPIAADSAERLRDDWDAIDTFWREQDAEGPGLFRLRRRLGEIPSIAVEPEPPAQVEQVPVVDSSPPIVVPVVSAAQQSMKSPLPVAITPTLVLPNSDEDIDSGVEKIFESLGPIQAYCLDQRPTLPLAFRLARQAAWITVEQLPASQGRTTRLSSPADAQRDTFVRLQQTGEPLDIIRFCEGRLSSFPFWLDLNRACHTALAQVDAIAAASTLALEVRTFMLRVPGLADLTFADGMPFADGATQLWLNSLAPASAGASHAQDPLNLRVTAAERLAVEGQLNEALADLQKAIETCANERDRFRLRTAQCALVHRFDAKAELYIPLESLLGQADESRLAQWEPDLVKPLLEMMLEHSDDPEWSRRLARLDLPGFWRSHRSLDT